MPVTLNQALSWKSATGDDAKMLDALQPNILKAHTREFLSILFLCFENAESGKALLRDLADPANALMKSAKAHLQEVEAFKTSETKGTPYVGVGITAKGYAALGIPADQQPADPSFGGGMKAAQLGDPPISDWEEVFQRDIHAAILVGDQLVGPRDAALAAVNTLITAQQGVKVVGVQKGNGLHNANGEGIEHFGYVDGRSQPLFLKEDVDAEMLGKDGAKNWDPAFGPGRAIVPDPAAPDPSVHFDSYFVFRKLEQNVQLFKKEQEALADRLGLVGDDRERAGAMIVGRFEDGTPLTLQFADGAHNPVPNDFNYDSDGEGGKCPFFGHIRKLNPRGSGGFEPQDKERLHLMARRGQTYGVRTDGPNDGRTDNKPTGDVGLLFMAFNAELDQQFEFTQRSWANNPGFPKVPASRATPGLDLVMGQGARSGIDCPLVWGADFNTPTGVSPEHEETTAIAQAVTMKGGEYFFMPSLPFLRGL
jgi:Dyp-type peroxidase family